ncbi:hypothetical protein QR680_019330 [Steinernema hermaphroditum]|uniref:Uncharacterized protein n=1 Tax=Steinernema hermaphroditum TaxID=289476 RepID=A0AA39LAX1_9BILA|nr:hypothetical protein QR680_019330 [Steinernema hermaphroditum]
MENPDKDADKRVLRKRRPHAGYYADSAYRPIGGSYQRSAPTATSIVTRSRAVTLSPPSRPEKTADNEQRSPKSTVDPIATSKTSSKPILKASKRDRTNTATIVNKNESAESSPQPNNVPTSLKSIVTIAEQLMAQSVAKPSRSSQTVLSQESTPSMSAKVPRKYQKRQPDTSPLVSSASKTTEKPVNGKPATIARSNKDRNVSASGASSSQLQIVTSFGSQDASMESAVKEHFARSLSRPSRVPAAKGHVNVKPQTMLHDAEQKRSSIPSSAEKESNKSLTEKSVQGSNKPVSSLSLRALEPPKKRWSARQNADEHKTMKSNDSPRSDQCTIEILESGKAIMNPKTTATTGSVLGQIPKKSNFASAPGNLASAPVTVKGKTEMKKSNTVAKISTGAELYGNANELQFMGTYPRRPHSLPCEVTVEGFTSACPEDGRSGVSRNFLNAVNFLLTQPDDPPITFGVKSANQVTTSANPSSTAQPSNTPSMVAPSFVQKAPNESVQLKSPAAANQPSGLTVGPPKSTAWHNFFMSHLLRSAPPSNKCLPANPPCNTDQSLISSLVTPAASSLRNISTQNVPVLSPSTPGSVRMPSVRMPPSANCPSKNYLKKTPRNPMTLPRPPLTAAPPKESASVKKLINKPQRNKLTKPKKETASPISSPTAPQYRPILPARQPFCGQFPTNTSGLSLHAVYPMLGQRFPPPSSGHLPASADCPVGPAKELQHSASHLNHTVPSQILRPVATSTNQNTFSGVRPPNSFQASPPSSAVPHNRPTLPGWVDLPYYLDTTGPYPEWKMDINKIYKTGYGLSTNPTMPSTGADIPSPQQSLTLTLPSNVVNNMTVPFNIGNISTNGSSGTPLALVNPPTTDPVLPSHTPGVPPVAEHSPLNPHFDGGRIRYDPFVSAFECTYGCSPLAMEFINP